MLPSPSNPSTCLSTVFSRSLALSYLFWHPQIRRYLSKLSPSRKFSQPFFYMKTSFNRAKKTALSSVRCPLWHIEISAKSVDSFVERWALQLAHYRASETAQKSLVENQLYTESQ